jgi:hypothetical protein
MKHIYRIEVTDTFCGESNYSWVRRYEFTAKSDLAAVRKAKNLAGWNGIRCEREDYSDQIVLRPRGICQIMFIDYVGE